MKIKDSAGKASVTFTWASEDGQVIEPESYAFRTSPAVEARIRALLTANEECVIRGGHTPADLRPYWEGLVYVLRKTGLEFGILWDIPGIQFAPKGLPDDVVF